MSDKYTHGAVLDIIEQESELTLEAMEYRSFSPGKPFKSGGLSIPETANNRAALGSLFDVDGAEKNRIIENVLFENDSCAIQGSLVITGQTYENNVNTLTGFFISGTGLLWLDFADTNLRDLDWSAYEHELNLTNVLASETPGGLNDLIVYDLIDRGKFVDETEVDIIERYPAFNLSEMLKNIFKGYDIISNFIDEDWFTSIYQMFTGTNEIRNSEEWKESALISIGNSVGQSYSLTINVAPKMFTLALTNIQFNDETSPYYDNGDNFNTSTGVYVVPETGTYRFILDMTASLDLGLSPGTINGVVTFYIYGGATVIATQTYTIIDGITNVIDGLLIDTDYLELASGTNVSCKVIVNGSYTDTIPAGWLNIGVECNISNKLSRWYGHGSTVKPSEILPDIKVNEYLKILFEHFAITPQYSIETNIVRLDVWRRQKSGIDLTTRLDPLTAEAEFFEAFNYELGFKPDTADKYGIDWFTRNENETGTYKANNGYKVFSRLQSDFSNTVTQQPIRLAGTPDTIPVIWSEVPEATKLSEYTHDIVPEWKTSCNYRLLIYAGLGDGEYTLGGYSTGIGRVESTENYPLFLPYTSSLNIEFADRNGLPGLHDRLHSAFIARINNGISLTIQGQLSTDFLTNLINNDDDVNLTTAIYIGFEPFNGMWTIQKITTDGIRSQLSLIRNEE